MPWFISLIDGNRRFNVCLVAINRAFVYELRFDCGESDSNQNIHDNRYRCVGLCKHRNNYGVR